MTRRAVFLDRDGVINEPVVRDGRPYPPSSIRELVLVPNAELSLARLKQEGFLLIVVTNQPDVRRGKTSQADVQEIHRFLSAQLPLDDFFTCFHDDSDACACRKPLPGMLRQAALKYDIVLETSYMIGDRWRDVEAGRAAGCQTIFVDRRYNESSNKAIAHRTVESLTDAVQWILHEEDKSS